MQRFAVGKELQDTEPSVAAVAFPAASQRLYVEHHLAYVMPRLVLVHAPSHIGRIIVHSGLAEVAVSVVPAQDQAQVGHLVHQFVPYLLAVIVGRILA